MADDIVSASPQLGLRAIAVRRIAGLTSGGWRPTSLRVLFWAAPALFTLYLYWDALHAWFLQDDFVWLSQLRTVTGVGSLAHVIFRPTVQGTLRPWSDRVFFLLFQKLFGLDAFPFHAWVFLTQFANFFLLLSVMRRLTGRRLAAFLAPILWTGNACLVMTMAWACLYKDILCAFFLLLAFHLFLRHIETGARRFYVWQWVVFLLGFGAMETNAVYPVIALGFAILCAPAHAKKAALLLLPSAVYLAWNILLVKKQAAGPYAMHLDAFLPINFLQYWMLVLKPDARLWEDHWTVMILPVLSTVCLAGFVYRQWRSGRRLPAFFLLWFVVTVLPILPLREQFQTYYVTGPSIGLAMLAADAMSSAWESRSGWRWLWRSVAVGLGLAFLIPSAGLARQQAGFWRDRGRRAEQLLLDVADARELHPSQTIVLAGMDAPLFWDVVPDGGFRATDVFDVYLAPGSESRIGRPPFRPDPADYVVSAEALRQNSSRVVVYDASGDLLRNITRRYLAQLSASPSSDMPQRVEVASRMMAPFLEGDWYPPDPAHRWMAKQAAVRLAGPQAAGESLHVLAVCPTGFLAAGPVTLTVKIDGKSLPPVVLRAETVDVSFPLPPEVRARQAIRVTLVVDPTHRPPEDGRDLGIAVRVVEIR